MSIPLSTETKRSFVGAAARPVDGRTGSRSSGNTDGEGRLRDEHVSQWIGEYVRRRKDAVAAGEADEVSARRDALPLEKLRACIAAHYAGLVESIARRFTGSGEPLEDMVQEGYLGLLSALEHYDPNKGVKFSTYATHFVAGAMRHCLRDKGKIIKEPAWLHDLVGKINRASDTLTQTLGRPPHAAEIAQTLNLTEEAVEEILSTRQVFQVASFNAGPEDDQRVVGLVDPEKIRSDRPVSLRLPIEDRIVLEAAVDKLKALEQKVLYEFFYKDLNQTEIAKKLGISCNYVSHILKNSTKKLRRVLGEAEVTDRGRGREASVVDRVTTLYTAAHIQSRWDEELSRAARGGYALALVVIDLDPLPPPGRGRDEILAVCGEAVKTSIRRVDLAGRFENDALIVLLPHTGAQAAIVAQRLRDVLCESVARAAPSGEGDPGGCLVRVGWALYPNQGRTPSDLLAVARGAATPEVCAAAAPSLRTA